MRRASSIATSNRQISSSPNAGAPRFWTLAWPRLVPVKELAVAGADFDQQQLTDGLGAALGTAAYMSPEQALGKPLDPRSDLFSFGIMLYEMCTGRSPFSGDTTGELLISIVQQVPVTPAQLNPDVPEALAQIIDRCLEKDREHRYQHASEIRADLKRLQHDPLMEIRVPLCSTSNTDIGARTLQRTRDEQPGGIHEINSAPALAGDSRSSFCAARRRLRLLLVASPATTESLELCPAHPGR